MSDPATGRFDPSYFGASRRTSQGALSSRCERLLRQPAVIGVSMRPS